jgi:acyl-CoA hydrolase
MSNFNNKLHGGELLKLLDQTASITGRRYSRKYVVTAQVIEVQYFAPIDIGDHVTLTGRVKKVGKSSMTIQVDVHTESAYSGNKILTNVATFIMVAMRDGRSSPVPPLED